MAEEVVPGLIELQTSVREFFGWDYQSDLSSAKLLTKSLNYAAPFGVDIWSPINRQRTLVRLKQKLLTAPKVVIVGASVSEEDFSDFDFDNSYLP